MDLQSVENEAKADARLESVSAQCWVGMVAFTRKYREK
jgi:hypothetical protein